MNKTKNKILHKCIMCKKTFLDEKNLDKHNSLCKIYIKMLNEKELKHEKYIKLTNVEYTNNLLKKKEKIILLREDLKKYNSIISFPALVLNKSVINVRNISEIDLSGICKAFNKNFKMYLASKEYKIFMKFYLILSPKTLQFCR